VGEYIIYIPTYLKIPERKGNALLSDFWLRLENTYLFIDTKCLPVPERTVRSVTLVGETHTAAERIAE